MPMVFELFCLCHVLCFLAMLQLKSNCKIKEDYLLMLMFPRCLQILQRLVTTLDRCASRTCSLPIETVELMPSYCSRFSLTCLQKLFSLSRYA